MSLEPETYREALLAVRNGEKPTGGSNVLRMLVDGHAEGSLRNRRWWEGKASGIRVGDDRYQLRLTDKGRAVLRAFGEDDSR